MEKTATIVDEPADEVYQGLLAFASRARSLFSLVWREQLKFEKSAHEIAGRLKPDLVSEARTDEWPGTQLVGHLAIVRTYRLSGNALALLNEDREAAVQALMLDPLTAAVCSLTEVRQMFDEMAATQQAYLPHFINPT